LQSVIKEHKYRLKKHLRNYLKDAGRPQKVNLWLKFLLLINQHLGTT